MGTKLLFVCCLVISVADFGLSAKIELPRRNGALNGRKTGVQFQQDNMDFIQYEYEFNEGFCADYYDYDRAQYLEGEGWADLFPHPFDCRAAIFCFGSEFVIGWCPDGLYFDIFDNLCGERREVTCSTGYSDYYH